MEDSEENIHVDIGAERVKQVVVPRNVVCFTLLAFVTSTCNGTQSVVSASWTF